MFGFIKKTLSNFFGSLGSRLKSIFTSGSAEQLNLAEFEKILLESDIGTQITERLVQNIEKLSKQKKIDFEILREELEAQLLGILSACKTPDSDPEIVMLVGVNGAGKTTFAAKLASQFKATGEKTLLVAGDTFRAAAADQINVWAERSGVELVQGNEGQDSASVVFLGAEKFLQENFQRMVIDTAGRLHTKVNLMAELNKLKKVLAKKLGESRKIATWLVVDAMLGQSSLSQAEIFHDATDLDGIILTKCDGPAKGGIIFAIAEKFNLPVIFLSSGQGFEDLERFDCKKFVHSFLQ